MDFGYVASTFKVQFQHRQRAVLSVLPRLDPLKIIAQWNSNSQRKDDPYAISLDRTNGQIHCANGVKIFSRHLRNPWVHGGLILLIPLSLHGEPVSFEKKTTNHLISNNSHPTVTANKSRHLLKGEVQKPKGTS